MLRKRIRSFGLLASSPRALTALALFALTCAGSRDARAAEEPVKDTPPVVRDGIVPSFTVHTGMARASGYPNDAREINNPQYFSASDLLFGTTTSFHVGYALTDYVTFGFMVNLDHYESAHWREHGAGFGMRLDGFPLLALVPRLRDLGAFMEFGIGTATLDPKVGNYPSSDGTQSYTAVGAFYELTLVKFRSSHLALAPEVKYTHIDASSITADSGSVGLRLAFYTSK